jgi:fructose-bisphosphate aldolase class I
MNDKKIKLTMEALLSDNKGLLAMDESTGTCNKRFEKLGIPQTIEVRRDYRELLVTTPHLAEYISGAILCDETIKQSTKAGIMMTKVLEQAGIVPGIKVDLGTMEMAGFPDEKITEGLDGLRTRLADYAKLGARFAKWRAVIVIGKSLPSAACIQTNMQTLASYAALCQEAGLVPIVEPEVLMDGTHSMQRCGEVTKEVLLALFEELHKQRVDISGLILKANMVLPGKDCPIQNSVDEIADATVQCLLDAIPASVPGIAFLSGGQTSELATARLNAMHVRFQGKLPWVLTFSFSRALQEPVLKLWAGVVENIPRAQQALIHRAQCNSSALNGAYDVSMEKTLPTILLSS